MGAGDRFPSLNYAQSREFKGNGLDLAFFASWRKEGLEMTSPGAGVDEIKC